ncbi:MAG: hypothetical protein JNN12_02825 [Bacteroidetes Order II. Incertae sedis bacterium]|nr:hypothetical protein [Bacteroidetes Order II. bacterium]
MTHRTLKADTSGGAMGGQSQFNPCPRSPAEGWEGAVGTVCLGTTGLHTSANGSVAA